MCLVLYLKWERPRQAAVHSVAQFRVALVPSYHKTVNKLDDRCRGLGAEEAQRGDLCARDLR